MNVVWNSGATRRPKPETLWNSDRYDVPLRDEVCCECAVLTILNIPLDRRGILFLNSTEDQMLFSKCLLMSLFLRSSQNIVYLFGQIPSPKGTLIRMARVDDWFLAENLLRTKRF